MPETEQKLHRILAFEAGATSLYVGGSLALQGHQVAFVASSDQVSDLRRQGITIELPSGRESLPEPEIYESLASALEAGPYDLGIFAHKAYQTRPTLEALEPYQGDLPPLLCLQNGVENEAVLGSSLGANRVIAGAVTSQIYQKSPVEVVVENVRGIGIAASQSLSHELASMMDEAELNPRLYARENDMKWSKMLTDLLGNATSAILDMPPEEIFQHPQLFRLEVAQLREALKVMSANGIRVVDLPGTPVRALSFSLRSLPISISRPLLKSAVGRRGLERMSPFHEDLHGPDEECEVLYIHGAVARFGQNLGVPTPINHTLTDILLSMSRGELGLQAFSHAPDKLLANFDSQISGKKSSRKT
jgi:2-dehydropantoate 2-reductase